jgi:CheY-like chemotaxis protein
MQTILVVDDEPKILKLVSALLEKRGYTVLPAADGEEALRIFRDNPGIDLLLADVVAPGMSGPMIADKVAELRPDIKVLFMSGYDGTQVVQKYVIERGYSLIAKPFTAKQLAAKISAVMAGDAKTAGERASSPSE